MVKKLLKLKIQFFIFTLLFLGAISGYAEPSATTNYSFSLLNKKAVVASDNNASNTFGENITLSDNLSFVNFLWADTPNAKAGFKEVFQKVEVTILKEEVGKKKDESIRVAVAPVIICPSDITVNVDAGNCNFSISSGLNLTTNIGTVNLAWKLSDATIDNGSDDLNSHF